MIFEQAFNFYSLFFKMLIISLLYEFEHNKNYFGMAEQIEAQLIDMIENIMINIGQARQVENLDILLEHDFYFEVSYLIFP